jgi:8-oxo-dGTP pyrophosphatase MutT (NUDIX family)
MTERTAAALCVYDKEGRVLMQHHPEDAPVLPNYWGFFGGMVDGDEPPEQTVRRELYEKAGYRPHKPVFFVKEKSMVGGVHVLTYIFVEGYDESQPIILRHGQAYGWFTVTDALKLDISPARGRTLRKICRHLQNLSR